MARREQAGPEADPYGLLSPLLDLLGDIAGRRVLDAGCGEGYLARALAAREAHVTGIDLSSLLIELARARDPGGRIDYQVADLSQPWPAGAGRFDSATPARSAPIAACGNPASRFTTITGRWRTTSTRSTRAASASPSSPTSSPGPTPTGQTRTCHQAAASPVTCSWHSANPEAGASTTRSAVRLPHRSPVRIWSQDGIEERTLDALAERRFRELRRQAGVAEVADPATDRGKTAAELTGCC